jgi:hypothetical protein
MIELVLALLALAANQPKFSSFFFYPVISVTLNLFIPASWSRLATRS